MDDRPSPDALGQRGGDRRPSGRVRRGRFFRAATLTGGAAVVVGLVAVNIGEYTGGGSAEAPHQHPPVVRPESRQLSTVDDTQATLVEFVDFECDACWDGDAAAENVHDRYSDRVTFVVRYFPCEDHENAQRAARAVEAAAQQGRFAAMYEKMIGTQTEWSGLTEPQDARFRGFAAELGLDLRAWDAAYSADSTWDRIQADIDDGRALGVTSAPGLFLNSQRIKPRSEAALSAALEEALVR